MKLTLILIAAVGAQETEIMATGLAPSDDNESAIVATLDPGP